jgi:outer membrane protein TolC
MHAKRRLPLIFAILAPLCAMADGGASSKTGSKLTLDAAVQMAIARNPDILRARQDIERTTGQIIEVRAQALPRVAATSSYDQQDRGLIETPPAGKSVPHVPPINVSGTTAPVIVLVPITSSPSYEIPDKRWRVAFQASQLLYSGGQVRSALNIAHHTKINSMYQLRDVVDHVISDTRQFFNEVILTRALIRVQEQSLQLLEEQLEDQKNRFDAGTVPRFNVLRAEVELANVRPELIRAKNDHVIAQLRLAKTLGVDSTPGQADPLPFVVDGEFTIPPQPLTLDQALATARERRAMLKSQREAIIIQKENVKVALSGYKPRLELSGGYEWHNSSYSEDLDQTVNGWFFGVQGSWNIFDGLETYGRFKQAKAQLKQALISYSDAERQVDLEVRGAFSKVQEAKEVIQSQTKNVEQADEALRLATERLDAGAGTQLEVLDARTARTRAQTTELQARYQYNVALAEFERICGVETEYDDTFDDPLVNHKHVAKAAPKPASMPVMARKK